MGVFNSTLPEIPEAVKGQYYNITFDSSNNTYYLYTGKKTVTTSDTTDTLSDTYGHYRTTANSSSWYHSQAGMGAVASYPVCRSDTVSLVYTNYDLYTSDGSVYLFSGSQEGYAVNNTLTASSVTTSLKNSVLPVVGLVAVAVVGFFAVRKAWDFIKGQVKGA